jgi:hypothetical protein
MFNFLKKHIKSKFQIEEETDLSKREFLRKSVMGAVGLTMSNPIMAEVNKIVFEDKENFFIKNNDKLEIEIKNISTQYETILRNKKTEKEEIRSFRTNFSGNLLYTGNYEKDKIICENFFKIFYPIKEQIKKVDIIIFKEILKGSNKAYHYLSIKSIMGSHKENSIFIRQKFNFRKEILFNELGHDFFNYVYNNIKKKEYEIMKINEFFSDFFELVYCYFETKDNIKRDDVFVLELRRIKNSRLKNYSLSRTIMFESLKENNFEEYKRKRDNDISYENNLNERLLILSNLKKYIDIFLPLKK